MASTSFFHHPTQLFGLPNRRIVALPLHRKRFGLQAVAYKSCPQPALNVNYHEILGVQPNTSCKQEIKKAYRRLALQYHPDVCKGELCERNFKQISDAYHILMSEATHVYDSVENLSEAIVEGFMGVGDDSWEEWEEWMGWEGAGTLDYSTHINDHIN